MSIEKPSKIICEICGGDHPATAHTNFHERKEKDPSKEMEPNHEAMEKVVDIFIAEDLKYRAYDPFITTLETGIPTPATGFLHEPFGRFDEDAKKKMRKGMENLAQERKRKRIGNAPFFDFEESQRFRKANVFYPEGLLKALRDHVIGSKTTEIWSEDYFDQADVEDVGWAFAVELLYKILKKLPAQEQENIARLIGRPVKQFDVLDHPALHARRPMFDPQTLNRWGQIEKDEKLTKFLQDLLSNKDIFEIIRKAWLEKFFSHSNSPPSGVEEYEEERMMVSDDYVPNYGFILSPQTKVAVASHPDFPAQATILTPRVSPKEFIGIFVNSGYSDRRDYVTDGAIEIDIKDDVEELSAQEQLEHAVFKTPDYPLVYLLSHYPHPFFIFLEQRGFKRDRLVKIFETFSDILNEAKNKRRQDWEYLDEERDYWGNTDNFVRNTELHGSLNERAFAIQKSLNYHLFGYRGREEYNQLEEMARKFIDEGSPVKDGETLWTGLVRRAEQNQLPIYNLRGELLWPKHMAHEEVTRFVTDRKSKTEVQESPPAPPVPSEQAGKKEG